MKIFKLIIFTFLFVGVSNKSFSQDTMNIPNGIVYKKTTEEINKKAEDIIRNELNSSTTTYELFDKIMYIGPILWKRYQNISAINKIQGGNVQFKVPTNNTTIIMSGKLIQTSNDYKTVWNQVLKDVNGAKLIFRKLNTVELKYYWAIIFYDIEEPVFIVETGKYKFLIQLLKNNFNLLWLDEIIPLF